jgi:hypothetical protein
MEKVGFHFSSRIASLADLEPCSQCVNAKVFSKLLVLPTVRNGGLMIMKAEFVAEFLAKATDK